MRRAISCALISVVLLTGCGGDGNGEPPKTEPSATPQQVPAEVQGIVTKTDGSTSFTIRASGKVYEIFVDSSIDYGFPLGHLRERLVGAGQLLIKTKMRDGQAVALEIEEV